MFNPALYPGIAPAAAAASAAEQQSRLYSQIYDRMRAMQQSMAMAAAQQQQLQLQQKHHLQLQQQQQQQQQPVASTSTSAASTPSASAGPKTKRRRTSANDSSSAPTHLTGEMIRRLREKQKMKNAAAVASAVASVAAVTTSGGRQFNRSISSSSPPAMPAASSSAATASTASRTTSDIKPSGGPGSATPRGPSPASASEVRKPMPPLMSRRDTTSADLEETVMNGQVITCFNIGGEMRLCLPQILKLILSDFHWEQICLACEELQIHVAPATTQQMVVLKGAGVLPIAAHQCGLITKSDAERLASFLNTSKNNGGTGGAGSGSGQQQQPGPPTGLGPGASSVSNNPPPVPAPGPATPSSNPPSARSSPSTMDQDQQSNQSWATNSVNENNPVSMDTSIGKEANSANVVYVQHECFGKAQGTLYPGMYRSPTAKCISCSTCGKS